MSKIYNCKNSDSLNKEDYNEDDIYLVYQYFIHSNDERYREIKFCLKRNIQLNLFKKIILLNERIYTADELGLTDEEMKFVEQININKRLKYIDVFLQIKNLGLDGYIVFCNSDIFFDKTINNLRKSCLSKSKSIYTLLRFEYNNQHKLDKCKLFKHPRTNKPRPDSQDVWIYHTSQLEITSDLIRNANFMLGMPGCDNKITYVLAQLGYKCINEPYNIKTYHYHSTQIRNYGRKDVIPPPYLYVEANY
jgi:hypothetical protein